MPRKPYCLTWAEELLADSYDLPAVSAPRLYWSQRQARQESPSAGELDDRQQLTAVITRVRDLVTRFERDHYFAKQFGFECVDDDEIGATSQTEQLALHVGKAHLPIAPSGMWTLDDLCDFIEVHHDNCARPTAGYFHSYGNCGWHPTRYSIAPGQALYRWRVNQLLATSGLGIRLAEAGEDRGRLVREGGQAQESAIAAALSSADDDIDEQVQHAVALYRGRKASRQEIRSAIVTLAGILESRRDQVKELLRSKEENALFEIANRYGLRHQNAKQLEDYGEQFLDWIFFSYLNAVSLTSQLLERPLAEDDGE